MSSCSVVSTSAAATRLVGAALAGVLVPGDLVVLSGDLGAGKTTLVQGAVAALGSAEQVTSPTFTLVRTYLTTPKVVHADLWRLVHPRELADLALFEELDDGAVVLVEWGERLAGLVGEEAFTVRIADAADPGTRILTLLGGPREAGRLGEVRRRLGSDALLQEGPELLDADGKGPR